VCLNDEEKGQIDGSNVVRDDGAAGSTAQPGCGFGVTPPYAIVHAVPEFIWGMSGNFRYPIDRIASATDWPWPLNTSTCRSFATIYSALCLFLGIPQSSIRP
jgi:hypothetical protein